MYLSVKCFRILYTAVYAKVKVRMYADEDDQRGRLVESTVGRFIFNQGIPQDLGYVQDREEDPYSLEIDFLCDKKKLGDIIDRCYRIHGNTDTVLMLDYIKGTGYHYSTIAAITIGISDMKIPEDKEDIIAESDAQVDKYDMAYRRGLVSEKERYTKVCEIWNKTTDDVADSLMESLGTLNNLYIMAHSGARGSKNQIRQIGGMRGLMANATGKTIEIPIKANFREGLSVLEYFLSSNGARKGLADTALRTADSGYLTRRLVDVSHNVIVREDDCGTVEGIEVTAFTDGKEVIEKLKDRIIGRTALLDIVHPETGEILVEEDCERISKRSKRQTAVPMLNRRKTKKGVDKMSENTNYEMNNFEALQIGLASPDKIRSWSHGEVTKPETINYRTLKPEMDGLYCERIFGPTKDWECHCGKYKRIRYKGIVCDKCGVEVTKAPMRHLSKSK